MIRRIPKTFLETDLIKLSWILANYRGADGRANVCDAKSYQKIFKSRERESVAHTKKSNKQMETRFHAYSSPLNSFLN